ncbi:MAG: RluA family pseudouridine synthase [Bdellovibrionota bacterium]
MKQTRWQWIVPAGAEPVRADRALLSAIEAGEGSWSGERPVAMTRSFVQKLLDSGAVLCDGTPARASMKVLPGQTWTLSVDPPRPMELVPEDRPIDILYEDEHLLIVNKPPGLTVHPSATQLEGTLVHALLHHVKDLSGIGGVLRPGIVHRIDKDTSGALVITKTDAAHVRLVETFSKHAIERSYWALCYGAPGHDARTRPVRVESLIGRNPKDRKKMSMEVQEGRRSVSFYRVLEEFGVPRAKAFASFLEVTLETGRTHQVRVHLTGEGHSLLGDPVYGTPTERLPKWLALPHSVRELVRALPGQALHARVLGFEHPVTGKRVRVEAEPPPAFAALLAELRRFG